MRMTPSVVNHIVLTLVVSLSLSVQAQTEDESQFTDGDDTTLDETLSSDEEVTSQPAPEPSAVEIPPPSAEPSAVEMPPPSATPSTVELPPPAEVEVPLAGDSSSENVQTEDVSEVAEEEQSEEVAEDESDETSPNEPVVIETPKAEVAAAPIEDASEVAARNRRLYGDRIFGRQRVHIAGNQPRFTERQALREKLYGKEKMYPTLTGDWFPLDWWVNPGLSMRMGGYSATGKSVKGSPTQEQIDSGDVEVDNNSKTTLLFIPLMVAAKVEMTPFRGKWLVFEGWAGYEYGWWQETGTAATASISLWKGASGSAGQESEPVRTAKGTKTALVFGGSANILLNWLDERTVRSMVDTMGIANVYMSPFFETVKSLNTDGISFSRNTIGLGFTFESAR